MANTFKFGNKNWAVKEDYVLAYNDENDNFKPLPFDFTRASTATYVDSDGLIKTAAAGHARIDYTDNTDGHLLLEPSRTNLNTLSDPTDAQKGSTSYASVTFQDDFNWALGSLLENAIVFGDNSTTRYSYYSNTVSSGTVYSLSFFIKMDDNSIPIPATDFLLVLAGTGIASGYNIDDYGNNVYRVSVTGTAGASNTSNGILKLASHSAKTFKITGFQIEAGSYATSYIPTEGASVTRTADSCINKNLQNVINSTEGVFYFEGSALNDDGTNRYLSLNDESGSNYIYFRYVSTSNQYLFRTAVGGVTVNTLSAYLSDTTENHKFALKFKSGDYAMWVDGVEISTDTSATIFSSNTLTTLEFDFPTDGADSFHTKTKNIRIYNTALTDAELKTLTT